MALSEIDCSSCGQTALSRQETEYEGFTRKGEVVVCTACGARYPLEEAPFVEGRTPAGVSTLFAEAERPRRPTLFSDDDKPVRPALFTDDDKPDRPSIFSEEERQCSCRYCVHYVLSAFDQRCGLTDATVAATDLCEQFERKSE